MFFHFISCIYFLGKYVFGALSTELNNSVMLVLTLSLSVDKVCGAMHLARQPIKLNVFKLNVFVLDTTFFSDFLAC